MWPDIDLRCADRRRRNHMARDIASWIELEAEGNVRWRLGAVRMHVQLEIDLRAGFDQPTGTVWEHVALFADRIFVEKDALLSDLE